MDCAREMPKYQCHKKVWALKIKDVTYDRPPLEGVPRGNATITPEDEGYAPFVVDEAWAMKNRPLPGGYYVVYEDGYKSYSPAAAFELGYAPIGKYNPINPVHNHLSVTVCQDAADAVAKGFDWAAAPDICKPIAVEQVVVVRNGTQGGNSTVDFVLEDATGQKFVFMVTGALLKSIPC